jgi:probable rRNA maturation factor
MTELIINNRQRLRPLDRKFLKGLAEEIIDELSIAKSELGLHFVSAEEMARIHKQYMNIEGSTDVITFDHGEEGRTPRAARSSAARSGAPKSIHGEIFISVDDAIAQSREFDTTWQNELARYMVHGILHLLAYDDLDSKSRAKMKREENRLLRHLEKTFDLRDIEKR